MPLTFFQPSQVDSTFNGYLRNRIINGAMMIDQRNAGASVTIGATASTYTLDRWSAQSINASKFSVQQNAGGVTPPAGFKNYLGVTSLAATTPGASDYYAVLQAIEGLNVPDINFGTANATPVTVSFWVRSSLTGSFGASIANSGASRSYPFAYTINGANTWEYKTITIPGDVSGTWLTTNGVGLYLIFDMGAGSSYKGTANTWASTTYYGATGTQALIGTNGATWYVTGVQLEVGSVATPFERRLYPQELAMCYRYAYFTQISGAGLFSGTTVVNVWYSGLNMRSAPTASITGTLKFRNITTGATTTANSPSVVGSPQNSQGGYLEINVSSFSAAPSANNVAALFCDGTNGVLLNSEL